ncbi:MAG: energy transducer TonB [Kiritimatiellae bacterium]|jgi:protein TonB|nr:energy transducer TonB [Kiritimatiellia bacterium]
MKAPASTDYSYVSPRWTLHSVLVAAVFTVGLYVLLPLTERFSQVPEPDRVVRELDVVRIPPPLEPPPPQEEPITESRVDAEIPEPQLVEAPSPSAPLPIPLDLRVGFGELTGDFRTQFTVEGDGLAAGMAPAVFSISELDQPPRPVVRVNPIYPPQARMRKIEGYVTVEFVVGIDGLVSGIQMVSREPGELFVRAVERAVKGWRFEPGQRGGEAVPSRVRQRIDFTLD